MMSTTRIPHGSSALGLLAWVLAWPAAAQSAPDSLAASVLVAAHSLPAPSSPMPSNAAPLQLA